MPSDAGDRRIRFENRFWSARDVAAFPRRGARLVKATARVALFRSYRAYHRLLHRVGVLPFDKAFGAQRGTPVGRHYVEAFLRRHSGRVTGRCLEFGEPVYRSFFPSATSYQVISIYPGPGVDYVCDIHDPVGMPEQSFDAIICTQVLEHLASPERALMSMARLLAPDGVLLLTAPFINNVHWDPTDYWRFTVDGMRLLLERAGLTIEELTYGGNSCVATGSLLGMIAQDFTQAELDVSDPIYPYNVLVCARKDGEGRRTAGGGLS